MIKESFCETFNEYFCCVAQSLSIPDYPSVLNKISRINQDLVKISAKTFKDHPSIKLINNIFKQAVAASYFFKRLFKRTRKISSTKVVQATETN